MPSTVPFWIAFVVTVALLVVSLVSGFRAKRRVHLVTGPLTIVAVAVTIFLTEQLSRAYDFPRDELDFHLIFAKAGVLLALPVVATGIWLWRNPRVRRLHLATVIVWLLAVLAATGTGLWVFDMATPKVG